MIRGQLEKYLDALGCVSGSVLEDGMFSVMDRLTLETYAKISVDRVGNIYLTEKATQLEDPIRRKTLLHTLQEYADTPLEKR